MLHDKTAQVIADAISVPPGPGQEMLHPIRGGVPSMLSDRPAILAGQPGQRPPQDIKSSTQPAMITRWPYPRPAPPHPALPAASAWHSARYE